ncbi:MAG: maleylacetate reductase, partial [Betaproteobacteria bacterium]|nr:maleylacetate reductase [Betaproteobacteria bacterium]
AELVQALGLPSRLSELSVKPESIDAIVAGAIDNLWVRTNPEPINDARQLHELLIKAW